VCLETSVIVCTLVGIGLAHSCSAQQGAAQILHPRHSCWRTAYPVVCKSRAYIGSTPR
jgi:hypothetical protein